MVKSSYLCGKCKRHGSFDCMCCDGTSLFVEDLNTIYTNFDYTRKEQQTMYPATYVSYRDIATAKAGLNAKYGKNDLEDMIKDVIFNDPATIVLWKDGTKTVVKAQEGCDFDPYVGLAMAFSKKMFGNKGSYFNVFKKYCEPYEDKKKKEFESVLKGIYNEIASKFLIPLSMLTGADIDGAPKPKDDK